MPLIARYLSRSIIQMSLMLLLGLTALFSFFYLLGEVSRVSSGQVTWADLILQVILLAPGHMYDLMPVAVLIGTLLALSQLVASSELTVIRTSGLSIGKTLVYLGISGVFFALLMLFLGEWLAPKSEQLAEEAWLSTTNKGASRTHSSGFWMKEDGQILTCEDILPDASLNKVRIYRFTDKGTLLGIDFAERARYLNPGQWLLEHGREVRFGVDHVRETPFSLQPWRSDLSPDSLQVYMVEPRLLSVFQLYDYIQLLKRTGQNSQKFTIALWGKLMSPLTCLIMVIIALPFANTQRRSGGVGLKIFTGVMLGLLFHFANKFGEYLGQLKGWPAPLVVSTPLLFFLLISAYLLYRQEKR